jgi:AraC-like DNA-binding protein
MPAVERANWARRALHRQGFRLFWRRKSRRPGRPRIPKEVQDLIADVEDGEVASAEALGRLWLAASVAACVLLSSGLRQRVPVVSITSTLVHRAKIRFHEPDDALRPYVGCFWVLTAERDATIHVVPDGSTAISIQLQNGRPSGWFLRGPLVRPEERRFPSPATLIGIRLRPGVAFILTGVAAHAMVGRRIRLNGTAAFQALVGEELCLNTPEECIDSLQRFLIERLRNASVHAVVARALREIEREHGCLRVADIAVRCHVSERHLNRLMRDWVGYGPKYLANMVRFQATLKQMEKSPSRSAAALAAETGYFDQAHLTLDLARFAAATPRHLASSCVADFSKTRCDDPL